MPPTFPSHQGLVAPLWRRWPGLFDAPALFIGAAMPDVVDGVAGLATGRLGQGLGHSLLALPLVCIPGGLVLWWAARRAAPSLPCSQRTGLLARSWNVGVETLRSGTGLSEGAAAWARVLFSLGVGAFSHLFIDLISHGEFRWFYPYWTTKDIFPGWWHIAWFRSPLPIYQGYPIGPHFLMWVFLGLVGAVLLFYPLVRDKRLGDMRYTGPARETAPSKEASSRKTSKGGEPPHTSTGE